VIVNMHGRTTIKIKGKCHITILHRARVHVLSVRCESNLPRNTVTEDFFFVCYEF
jgi:hypothetical protein